MTEAIDMKLSKGPAGQENEIRLSLDQFNKITQKHLTRIAEAEHSLQLICILFEKSNIRPVQCKKAIKSLNEMNAYVEEFCKLLNMTSYIPLVFNALRYRLLVILHLVEANIDKSLDLLMRFRIICMTADHHALQQHQEISISFKELFQHLAEIPHQVKILQDEAIFQEQRLLSSLKEQSSILAESPA